MPQHISIRVPWHDNGWDGNVCLDPQNNNACLRLKNIAENRDDKKETEIRGQGMADYACCLSCIGEGARFMSSDEITKETIHPYKKSSPSTHGHFLPTNVTYPPYSFPARPFAWLMTNRLIEVKDRYNIDYLPEREPSLSFNSIWVQDATNQKAVFDYFYNNVVENQSLCIAYAKQVPFVEDVRRVVVGIGHVKKIVPAIPHNCKNTSPLRSMVWETMVCHSIRQDHEDGFVIPYQQMMEYAENHPEFNMESITIFAPDDAFEEFSYATEHVSYDAVIDILQSCIKAFEIINNCLDEDYTNVLEWLNRQLSIVWDDRGAFPGLGAMMCALEIPQGVLIAKQMQESIGDDTDVWDRFDALIANPNQYLEPLLAKAITPIVKKTWNHMSDERKQLFRLLSRFSLSIEQAAILFSKNKREINDIIVADKEIIENPYILYEKTRLKSNIIRISVKKVDRAVFPIVSIRERFPLEKDSALTSDNDERRVRAIAIAVLEEEAAAGNTIVPCNMLVNKMQDLILAPECKVTEDILNALENFFSTEILQRKMKDASAYYKLVRINEFDRIIEKRISKRIKAKKLVVDADWRKLIDKEFGIVSDEKEEQARKEKTAALNVLSESRISVLVGDAGTGKTTVLSILCNHPDIKARGVLLLAPTGKATVRLLESMGDNADGLEALNVAQFLIRSKRFDWNDMRYRLSKYSVNSEYGTVIIDEASMLTEEMFGALLQALKCADRIIFVGDPNQLPPIGAGRPFVDLVGLLQMKLNKGAFPRVCDCYAELTVNRRQRSDVERLDVELSKLFTQNEKEIDMIDESIARIVKGESQSISFVKWTTKEELEEKLLQIMADETGMKSTDDQEGFDLSLGAEKGDYSVYFSRGHAEHAEKWQILAPVRNMPHGVMNINRLIHLKYREKLIKRSQHYCDWKKYPKPIGPESIIYGDKVINVINRGMNAWPETGRNYVANGEIGIACDSYVSKKKEYLKIEFVSQKGYVYSYSKNDFIEESGTAPLELAYALTVHKAQGSQFDTVILVLSEPCRIISRELLYTALTRQIGRIVILYNNEPYHLMKYSSDENSDIARRFTDLFAGVFYEEKHDMRPNIVRVKDQFFEDRLIHRTAKGELVRSKSEVIIANALYYHNLDYEYEPELIIEDRTYRPDFKIADYDTGDIWYWEHCGMMSDLAYKERWEKKKAHYAANGIIEGENLIVTYDENGALDSQKISQIIENIFE